MKAEPESEILVNPPPQAPPASNDKTSGTDQEELREEGNEDVKPFCSDKVISVVVLLASGLAFGLGVGLTNRRPKYADCDQLEEGYREKLGNGECDLVLNTKECLYDGGDCKSRNAKYMNCVPGTQPSLLEQLGSTWGNCNQDYNREECGYDDGNCIELNEKYPECMTAYSSKLGDGRCDHFLGLNTEECGYDGGGEY